MIRIKLSLKLGILSGVIWGFFFAAYYSMLPSFEFAVKSASICFVSLVIVGLGLPIFIKAMKKGKETDKDREEEP